MSARDSRQSKFDREQKLLDEALEETFPASDPPAIVGPGGGITGPEDAPRQKIVRNRPDREQGRRKSGS